MKILATIIVVVWSNIFLLPFCEGFESKTFQELGKIKKVSIDIHAYKANLLIETQVMHDKLASDLNGLIDAMIDEIGSGKERVHEDDFKNLNTSLTELQQNFQNDIKLFNNEKRLTNAFVAPILTYILIVEGIPFILKQIESWQNENKVLKEERINQLKSYKWMFVFPN